ncbi:MAG: hypothetical protein Q4A21_03650 [bacterium]|nr:hypothetical protein [bacterium]
MSYIIDERETHIRYDEKDNCWFLESSVRKHINQIIKSESCFEQIDKEIENGVVIYVSAMLSDLENFSINPFVKPKRRLSDNQKQELLSRLQSKST